METEIRSKWCYRDYCDRISAVQSKRVMGALVATLLIGEAVLRLFPIEYRRTSRSADQGIRAMVAAMEFDPRPKIVAVGDSTLVGAGVPEESQTVMGMIHAEMRPKVGVYNLAIPGGDCYSSSMLLRGLNLRQIKGVETVIVELLPSRFFVTASQPEATRSEGVVAQELERNFPYASPPESAEISPDLTMPARNEAIVEYQFAKFSVLYRNRDYFRIENVGNTPGFWLAGKVLPRGLQRSLAPSKVVGNNRLSAHADEGAYSPAVGVDSSAEVAFSDRGETQYLAAALAEARKLTSGKIIVLVDPLHYTYDRLTPAARASYRTALEKLDLVVKLEAEKVQASVVAIPSDDYQDPSWWTLTPAHFNAAMHREIWNRISPLLKQD